MNYQLVIERKEQGNKNEPFMLDNYYALRSEKHKI